MFRTSTYHTNKEEWSKLTVFDIQCYEGIDCDRFADEQWPLALGTRTHLYPRTWLTSGRLTRMESRRCISGGCVLSSFDFSPPVSTFDWKINKVKLVYKTQVSKLLSCWQFKVSPGLRLNFLNATVNDHLSLFGYENTVSASKSCAQITGFGDEYIINKKPVNVTGNGSDTQIDQSEPTEVCYQEFTFLLRPVQGCIFSSNNTIVWNWHLLCILILFRILDWNVFHPLLAIKMNSNIPSMRYWPALVLLKNVTP